MTKKTLYLSSNMSELNKLAEIPNEVKTKSARLLQGSATKMFDEAERLLKDGDEEKAYVMFMKYFNIIQLIKTSADYRAKKEFYDKCLGPTKVKKAIESAEKISKSLKKRYDLKEAELVAKKLTDRDLKETSEALAKKQTKDVDNSAVVNGHVTDDHVTLTDENGEVKGDKPVAKNVKEQPFSAGQIGPRDLYKMLNDAESTLLIMDTRLESDYVESHIKCGKNDIVNVPCDIIDKGALVKKIEGKLSPDSKSIWDTRASADYIILLDWRSYGVDVIPGTCMKTLHDALYRFDTKVVIKSEPLILEGGYRNWLLHYPAVTTNPLCDHPAWTPKTTTPVNLLDFDYPDLDDGFLDSPTVEATPPTTNGLPNVKTDGILDILTGPTTTQNDAKVSIPKFDRSKKPTSNVDGYTSLSSHLSLLSNLSQSNKNTVDGGVNRDANMGEGGVNIHTTKGVGGERRAETKGGINLDKTKGVGGINLGKAKGVGMGGLDRTEGVGRVISDSDLITAETEELERLKKDKHRVTLEHQARTERLNKDKQEMASMAEKKRQSHEEMEKMLEQKRKVEAELLDAEKRRLEQLDLENMQEQKSRQKDVVRQREERKIKEDEEKKIEEKRLKEKRLEENRLEEKRRLEEEKIKEEAVRKKEEADKRRDEEEEKQRKEKLLKEKAETQRITREMERKEREEKERVAKEQKEKELLAREKERLAREKEQKEQERIEREMQELKLKEQAHRQEVDLQHRIEEKRREKQLLEQKKEKERQEKVAREEAENKRREERISQESTPSSNVTPVKLARGWEKIWDSRSERYYYRDHINRVTQWEPPSLEQLPTTKFRAVYYRDHINRVTQWEPPSLEQLLSPDTYTMSLRDDTDSGRGGLIRSHSSPDVSKLVDQPKSARSTTPLINRTSKPALIQPQSKPTFEQINAARNRDLNPVYGNIGRALTGLRNLGNTCYMNSTIQCLNNCSPLVLYFLHDNYLANINRQSKVGYRGEVVDEFAVVVKALWAGKYRSISSRDFKSTCGQHNTTFSTYEQQDSQEFLAFLLDALHEGLNDVKKKPILPEQNNDNISDSIAADRAWENYRLLNKSIIVQLFQGQLKSTLVCLTCKKKSVTFDTFQYLTLPLPSSTRCSLQDCMNQFVREEKLSGSSRWKCPRCKVERDSVKKLDIWKLPNILIIHLNRFFFEGMWRQKLNTNVDFPLNNLDLNGYTAGPKKMNDFNLYAVTNHYGTMEGGHYTAYCKSPSTSTWHKFDDAEVSEISQSTVKSSAGYFLFYTSVQLNPV